MLALVLAFWAGLSCARPAPVPEEAAPSALPPLPKPSAPTPCLRIAHLVAHKAERTLEIRCEGGFVFSVPAAFSREHSGAKRSAGDGLTPEGEYHIAGPARASRFHRFVPIDYPSPADADAALAERRISAADHRRILDAHRRGVMPPQDTPLGGHLGLHGEGPRWRGDSKSLDWTYGCIALADGDLDFVIERVRKGTSVTILPLTGPPSTEPR